MEGLIVAAFVLSTIAAVFGLVTAIAVGYVIYRYCYLPWRVIRADIAALNTEVAGLRQQAQVRAMTDADVARAEARLSARQRARLEMDRG